MGIFIALMVLVVGSSIWVFTDSSGLGIPLNFQKKISFWNGGGGYFLLCLLLWIFVFPIYILIRGRIVRGRSGKDKLYAATPKLSTEQEIKMAKLFKVDVNIPKQNCPHCGSSNYTTFVYCSNCAREIGLAIEPERNKNNNGRPASIQTAIGKDNGKRYCTRCGKENTATSKFCFDCGNQLSS